MKQWPAGVNSCFAEVTEDDILRIQNIRIFNNAKKATKLGMKTLLFVQPRHSKLYCLCNRDIQNFIVCAIELSNIFVLKCFDF